MSVPTYQQILAQQYEESARDLLVQHQDYEHLEGEIDPHNSLNQVGTTLENPEAFQQFGGDRGTEEHIIVPKTFVDVGTTSVRYRKDVQNDIFVIDTRFRSYAVAGVPQTTASLVTNPNYVSPVLSTATSITSDFVFHIQRLVRNVMSTTLTSFELPNNFFNLVDIRNNYFIYIRAGYDENIPFALIGLNTKYIGGTQIKVDNEAGLVPGMSIIFAENLGEIRGETTYYILNIGSGTITVSLTPGGSPINPNAVIGTHTQAIASYYTQVPVFITDINLSSSPVGGQVLGPVGENGFYYSNTSIVPALNIALQTVGITDITVSYSNGYCSFNNNSTTPYTLNFTETSSLTNPQIYRTLGGMLGFNNLIYKLNPINTTPPISSPCDFQCGQISACQCYGILTGEDPINMNADPYIYISIGDWDNIRHQSINDSYFTAFARIPIIVPKGQLIYDTVTNNTVTKKYYFLQPTNLQQFEIKLLDMNGNLLLMPNTNWTMALEMEEVLSQALYEKLREL
jgi:hypothetical protein